MAALTWSFTRATGPEVERCVKCRSSTAWICGLKRKMVPVTASQRTNGIQNKAGVEVPAPDRAVLQPGLLDGYCDCGCSSHAVSSVLELG
jgi:hypothetical protein